jgi:hypothetical protein
LYLERVGVMNLYPVYIECDCGNQDQVVHLSFDIICETNHSSGFVICRCSLCGRKALGRLRSGWVVVWQDIEI